jgi:hypothetical protein
MENNLSKSDLYPGEPGINPPKPEENPDPSRKVPEKNDPTKIEEPEKIDPTRIKEPPQPPKAI